MVPEKFVYQVALLPFLVFYVLFAVVIYPLATTLHPTHLLETWKAMLPGGGSGWLGLGRIAWDLITAGARDGCTVFRSLVGTERA